MRNTWTCDELIFIRNNYKTMSDSEISAHLKTHSETSVATKRKRMGLCREKLKHSFSDVLLAFSKTNYELLSDSSDFKDTATNSLKYICPKHRDKGVQIISLGHLENGRGCYWCGREKTESARKTGLTLEKIEADKALCEQKNFQYIETTRLNGKITITFICNLHPNAGIQYMRSSNMVRNIDAGCKHCLEKTKYRFSKGERRIEDYLKKKGYDYIMQYAFDDCRDKIPLPFDFYITSKNILVEYDGEHHFRPVNFNGISDEEALANHQNTLKHDAMKNDYCSKNQLPLIRIPYTDYNNIESILDKQIT